MKYLFCILRSDTKVEIDYFANNQINTYFSGGFNEV
jgi:hypothetical protein